MKIEKVMVVVIVWTLIMMIILSASNVCILVKNVLLILYVHHVMGNSDKIFPPVYVKMVILMTIPTSIAKNALPPTK